MGNPLEEQMLNLRIGYLVAIIVMIKFLTKTKMKFCLATNLVYLQKKLKVNVTKPGRKTPSKKVVFVDQKQMVYFSEKYAIKERKERAKELIKHPQKYIRITSGGNAAYVRNISFDKNTGEMINGKILSLDIEKILDEEKYDGYYSIVISELTMKDLQIRKIYKDLAKIEDSFKVTKTYFESRLIFARINT